MTSPTTYPCIPLLGYASAQRCSSAAAARPVIFQSGVNLVLTFRSGLRLGLRAPQPAKPPCKSVAARRSPLLIVETREARDLAAPPVFHRLENYRSCGSAGSAGCAALAARPGYFTCPGWPARQAQVGRNQNGWSATSECVGSATLPCPPLPRSSLVRKRIGDVDRAGPPRPRQPPAARQGTARGRGTNQRTRRPRQLSGNEGGLACLLLAASSCALALRAVAAYLQQTRNGEIDIASAELKPVTNQST